MQPKPPANLTLDQRRQLRPGVLVEYQLAGLIQPGRGTPYVLYPSGTVELNCGTLIYPTDRLTLLSPRPSRFPNRPEFPPDDQVSRDLPQDPAPCKTFTPRHFTLLPKTCADCPRVYTPTSANQKRCPDCGKAHTLAYNAARAATLRASLRQQP
jgi:hypothetical protein